MRLSHIDTIVDAFQAAINSETLLAFISAAPLQISSKPPLLIQISATT